MKILKCIVFIFIILIINCIVSICINYAFNLSTRQYIAFIMGITLYTITLFMVDDFISYMSNEK